MTMVSIVIEVFGVYRFIYSPSKKEGEIAGMYKLRKMQETSNGGGGGNNPLKVAEHFRENARM